MTPARRSLITPIQFLTLKHIAHAFVQLHSDTLLTWNQILLTMSHRAARCLRPYLFHGFKRSQSLATSRAFTSSTIVSSIQTPKDVTHDYEKRLAQLDAYKPRDEWYPRISNVERMPVEVFQRDYAQLANDETRDNTRTIIGTLLPQNT